MKKTLLIFFQVLLCCSLFAQKNKADSLTELLKSAKDTARVNLLNELSKSLWYYNLNQANDYNLNAISLADSISFKKGLAEANRCRGVILSFKNDTTGLSFLEKASSLYRQLNDKRGTAATLNNQGNSYLKQGKYAKALEVEFESLQLFNELHDNEAIGAVTNQVGVIYNMQSDFATALDYFLKALAIRQQIGDKPGTAFSLTRVGDMYNRLNQLPQALDYYQQAYKLSQTLGRNQNLIDINTSIGDIYKKRGEYTEALNYYTAGLKAEEDYNGKEAAVISYGRLGDVYLLQKNYSSALESFQKALDNSNKKNPSESAPILYSISNVYYEMGDYANTLKMAMQSLGIASKNKNYDQVKNASRIISRVYAAKGIYQQAYQYQLQYDNAKDSVLNVDMNKRLASLQQSLEIKNRQTQIDLLNRDKQLKESELNRQKQQRYAFIAGILLFLILVILLARNNRHKQKANIILQDQKKQIETALAELKTTQAQLVQKEKMASLGELTAGIAHEIQNPLNFVNNFSEVSGELISELVDGVEKGNTTEIKAIAKDLQQNLEKINHHGKRADAIVKGMLQHSRTSTGQKEPADINELCDEYLRLAYHGLRARDKNFNVKIETDFDNSIGKINIIPQDIGRVLLNIINNAFYAVALPPFEGFRDSNYEHIPTVIIKTSKILSSTTAGMPGAKGPFVKIQVTDNGPGIPPNILDKIFQPFFTTKPTGRGTGLGLSLSYDIIKAHGGEIKVNSEEGKETEFIVQIPMI